MNIEEEELRTIIGAMLGGLLVVNNPKSAGAKKAKQWLGEWMEKPTTQAWIDKWQAWYAGEPIKPMEKDATELELAVRADELVNLARSHYNAIRDNSKEVDWDKLDREEKESWDKLRKLNDDAIEYGTLIGRFYREGRGDGYAQYVCVDRINDATCELELLPFGDAWDAPWIANLNGIVPIQGLRFMRHTQNDLFGKKPKSD